MSDKVDVYAKALGTMCVIVFLCYALIGTISSEFSTRSTEGKLYRFKNYKLEKEFGDRNLNQTDYIRKQNSDPLPPRSDNRTAKELCSGRGMTCLPPVPHYESRWKVVAKYKTAACVIQKSMSTVMISIMCFLANETGYKAESVNFTGSRKWWDRLCEGIQENNIIKLRKKYNTTLEDTSWKYLVVTRDPVDRFLSGFLDKCIRKPTQVDHCNGCGSNMTCFLIKEYERVQTSMKGRIIPGSFEDRHFLPQSWRCRIIRLKNRMSFIKYTSDPSQGMLDQLTTILRGQNVSQESLDFIEQQLVTRRTVHTTVTSVPRKFLEERLRNSPFLMEYIVKLFYIDYVTLGYPIPEI